MPLQTPAEQAQARMKMALKAAAMADEKLKEQTGMYQSSYLNPSSSKDFADAVASIELDNFSPSVFKSSRSTKSSLKVLLYDLGISNTSFYQL